EPSGNLIWVPCYDNFTCANLEVPLDYEHLSAGYTNVAFIKHEGSDPSAEDIIFNPGGPGGSGVNYIRKGYNSLRNKKPGIGWEYNLISFDPRGVKNSGPNLDCFGKNKIAKALYHSSFSSFSGTRMSAAVSVGSKYLPPGFAQVEALGKFCSEVHKNGDAGHAGTVAVAQDLMHFIQVRAASRGRPAAQAALNFYGGSYGTVIGSTFAALYPDRVRRMILDGVVDAPGWYKGTNWGDLRQVDECVQSFFNTCYAAGLKCALNKGAKSPADIQARFDAVLKDIEAYPIPVFDPRLVSMPVVIEIDHVLSLVFAALYSPLQRFPFLAEIFEALERRDGTEFVKSQKFGKLSLMQGPPLFRSLSLSPPKSQIFDGKPFLDDSGQVRCRYLTNVGSKFAQPINTSTPILFLTNALDPITPSATEMSSIFTDSIVLTANATGHCMTDSKCSRGYVKKYLATGQLPPKNAMCEVEQIPFLSKIEAQRFIAWYVMDGDDEEHSLLWL
ncbi:hypothetical protein K491DRAFT_585910, partial [Lophiostoma macrostomum CBS 122681]